MIVTQLQQVEHTIHRNGASEREKEKKVSPNTMAILLATMNEQQQQQKNQIKIVNKTLFSIIFASNYNTWCAREKKGIHSSGEREPKKGETERYEKTIKAARVCI